MQSKPAYKGLFHKSKLDSRIFVICPCEANLMLKTSIARLPANIKAASLLVPTWPAVTTLYGAQQMDSTVGIYCLYPKLVSPPYSKSSLRVAVEVGKVVI